MAAKPKQKTACTLRQFYLEDLPRTLFPLATNRVLVERGLDDLVVYG